MTLVGPTVHIHHFRQKASADENEILFCGTSYFGDLSLSVAYGTLP